jgi:hypothetical protein
LFLFNSIYTIAKIIINSLSCKKNYSICEFSELISLSGLSPIQIKKLAKDLGVIKRNSSKFDPLIFLAVICLRSQYGSPSYNDIAAKIESTYGISLTKQALCKRINESCVLFFQTVLGQIIQSKYDNNAIKTLSENHKYGRVLIQDSTIVKVPSRLFEIYSGVSNGHSSVCNIRIQGVYNLISGNFVSFSIDAYSKNDFTAAPELDIYKYDLVLRDRGYFSYSEILRHISCGADCILRHKMKNIYLQPDSGEPIQLTKLLKKNKFLDLIVCLNNSQKTKVRLIAQPVPESVANERKRKAKLQMRGHNPSKEVLELMEYTIYITTITDKAFDFKKIDEIYGLRWKIEIIFKIWKSHLSFDKIHTVSNIQLLLIFHARFIMIVLYSNYLYVPYFKMIKEEKHNRYLSMMKFIKYLMNNQLELTILVQEVKLMRDTTTKNEIVRKLIRYCAYDKRKRLNMCDLEFKLSLS